MITRRTLLTGASLMALAPCFSSVSFAATPKKILVFGKAIDDVVNGFDPAEVYEFTNFEVCANVYQMIVKIDPADSSKQVGDIAESWDLSKDGKTFTFKLRPGIHFDSGNPVTAEDAAFSLQRVIKLNKVSAGDFDPMGWTAQNVESMIRAVDPSTLVITQASALAPGILLSCLSNLIGGCVVDKKVVMANEIAGDLGNGWLRTHSAGSGSYRLVEWQASDHVILEANPRSSVQPNIPRVVIRHVADPATQLLLLKKGDLDVARDLGADQIRSIADDANIETTSNDALASMYLVMNMGLPQFQKPQVLQAIKHAIDYEAIADNITPKAWKVWQSFIPDGVAGADPKKPFSKDIEKAKALLAEAGYKDGFSVTLDHYALWPYADIAQALQASLAEINIKVELKAGAFGEVTSKSRARQHQMLLGQWGGSYADPNGNALPFCVNLDDSDDSKSKSLAWRSHFKDIELADAANAAAAELDVEKRVALYGPLQEKFAERSPFAIILQKKNVSAARKGVSGFKVDIISVGHLAEVAKEG